MAVIKKLGDRVEREHLQFLKDSQRIEDKSGTEFGTGSVGGSTNGVDFASLVAGASTSTVKPDAVVENGKSWDDDVWGTLLNDVRRNLFGAVCRKLIVTLESTSTEPVRYLYNVPDAENPHITISPRHTPSVGSLLEYISRSDRSCF